MNDWSPERRARAALTHVCESARPELVRQLTEHGAEQVWAAVRRGHGPERWSRRAEVLNLDAALRTSDAAGVRFVIPGDREWPTHLDVLDEVEVSGQGGQPVGLWVRGPGDLALWSADAVALVGSRASSPYGERVATDLSIDLAGEPGGSWTIISGGAYGIDGSAHRGACAAHGRTIAVLASGLDAPYPRGNQVLFDQLLADHLLVSEVPCGMHPTKVGFLARNRLIAALAQGTVVVEAASRSGASNTASWAAGCGRVVMAVPGPVHSALSATPHRLIRDHQAALVSDHRDVRALLERLDATRVEPVGGQPRLFDSVDPTLMGVREVMPGRGGLPTGEFARRAGLSIPQTLASLAQLQQMGLVRSDQTGQWRICTPGGAPHGAT